ncbi:MAG: biotin--[Clostridia bacterium]|nr:biotin--[acetyl-CoA-carboxylase] ligase [Clostridia bacterium]
MTAERLNETEITRRLGARELAVRVYACVDSTNSEAKRYALAGGATPCAFLAEAQSAGRGRMGRSFYSPEGTGLYLSLLIPAEGALSDAVMLTTGAAVAVRRAIFQVTGRETGIKWVNDLYLEGRKVCGILAESFFVEQKRYVVLGVGVNLYTEDFPEELRLIAGSLLPQPRAVRNALAAALLAELYDLTEKLEPDTLMEEYRAASLVLGRQITYTENGVSRVGRAESVDDRGRLHVRHEDGSQAVLASGEISLRLNEA